MANYDLTYEGSEVQGILDTGEKLKADGYILMGGASPSTLPGTPTKRVAYIGGPGSYSNFGSTVVVPSGSFGVFKYDGSQWVCTVISPSVPVSTTVQDNDTTVPTGKAVKTAVDGAVGDETTAREEAEAALQGLIDEITDNIENGYVYAGIATPSTTPVTGKVFYMALQGGMYTHFDNTAVMQGINIFKYNGSSWLHDAYISISDKPIPSDTGLVKAGGTFDFVMDNGSAFDLSKFFASGSTLATYENLDAALADLDSLDEDYKRGGMSIRYVQTSDNKYIQCRLMADAFTIDVTQWQGVDNEVKYYSKNLVESGAVKDEIDYTLKYKSAEVKQTADTDGFAVSDESGNEIINFKDGHFKTKEFNSSEMKNDVDYLKVVQEDYAPNIFNDTDSSEFDIADGEGNTIVSFEDGGIKTKDFNSVESPQGKYDDSDEDLGLSDNSGNMIIEFKNGHIKTANFDSSKLQTPLMELTIGELKSGTINIGGYAVIPSSYSLITDSVGIPYYEATLYFKINYPYRVYVIGGYTDGDNGVKYSNNLGTFVNGDSLKLPLYISESIRLLFLRFKVGRLDDSPIAESENVNLHVTYKPLCDVIDSNSDIIDMVQIASTKAESGKLVKNYNTIIVHGSDVHGDWERLKNLYKVAESINADAIAITGDMVPHNHRDGLSPFISLAKRYNNIPTCVCSGNHEAGYGGGIAQTDQQVFDYVFDELSEEFSYLSSSGNITTVPYYYKDIINKNIRIISIHQYVEGSTGLRWNIHYNQEEIDWFCNTLLSTPDNYGIIVLYHTPEISQNEGKITGNDLFFTNYNFGNPQTSVTNGYVIREILDAFIARQSFEKTFTQNGTPSSISVDIDFSNVSNTVELIAQLNGHYHRDAVGLVSGASERQVSLNIASTIGFRDCSAYPHYAEGVDCYRNVKNNNGNSFNIYVINRDTKKISIFKIGAHRTIDNRNRTYMEIQY